MENLPQLNEPTKSRDAAAAVVNAQECLEWEKAKAKERQVAAGSEGSKGGRGNKKPSETNVAKGSSPQRATDKAGEAAGVSGKTVEPLCGP